VLGDEFLINPMDDVHLAFCHLLVLKDSSILALRLPSPVGPWTSSIYNFPSLNDNSFGCNFSFLMYGLMMSAREFSSDEPDKEIVTLKLRTIS
jgi:hypothetical protein